MKFENENWAQFKGETWKKEINVRDFIQNNYKPYNGDDTFLVPSSEKTKKVWNKLTEMFKVEREKGVYDAETKLPQGIDTYGPGYIDKENEIAAQNERSEQDFIKYFNGIISKRHPNSSNSIIVNWTRVGELLKIYSQGNPIPFKTISVKLLEDIKMFLLRAPMGGNKKGTISQNTASTYFSILKAGLKQAFVDEYLTVDISAKIKGITNIETPRVALTMNEVQMLIDTPCKDDVLKRAFLFSILTGLRHSDIQALKWQQIQQTSKGTWQAVVIQQKTKRPAYKPVIQQALQLCGERPSNDDALVFEGLTDASWISRPLKAWIEASGIKKHITFHCGRHSYASLLLENGVDIYTIKSLMGHTNVRTTQIYTHIVNEQKEKAANTLHIDNWDL